MTVITDVVIPETIEPILAWVRTQHPQMEIGTCGNPELCIVAQYLSEQYPDLSFEVHPSHGEQQPIGWVTYHHRDLDIEWLYEPHADEMLVRKGLAIRRWMSPAINDFASAFDDLATEEEAVQGGEAMMMTASEFLKRWEARQ